LVTAVDRRVVVKRQSTNRGFVEALNTGCRAATGTYIARMDADDVSVADRFDRQLSYLRAHRDIGVLGGSLQLIDRDGQAGRVRRFPTLPGAVAWSMMFFNSIAHPAVMMRRDVLERAGLYPEGCKGGTEDYALFMRLSRCTRVANLPQVVLRYRQWGGNMSMSKYEDQQREADRIVAEALVELGFADASTTDATALRGLALGRYPSDPTDIHALADLIDRLRETFVARFDDADRTAINADAGVKLCLLAARSLTVSPKLSFKLARRAMAVSPTAPLRFTAKALGTIACSR
jgi:glycosyltransferase involved in cell wall biosynthesis